MKGIQALIIALGLGIAGAILNFAYLSSRSEEKEMIYFIGVKPATTINRGDPIREDFLQKVGIPKENVGNLGDFAVRWESRQTVIGTPVSRTLPGGSLLLRDDYRTPPPELKLSDENSEGLIWVPVDTRGFVPSLLRPGDMVSFLIPQFAPGVLRPAVPVPGEIKPTPEGTPAETAPPAPPATGDEVIGPFKVLSLGNRLGSTDVTKAAKIPVLQENVIGIAAKLDNGRLDPKVAHLRARLEATGFRNVDVFLHPRKTQ
jgi:hypothetical protein